MLIASVLLIFAVSVSAAPGAHGPDGQHIQAETGPSGEIHPSFEALTETFEVGGQLRSEHLLIYLHDYATNVAVAGASIEVESQGRALMATYDADTQAYRIDDETLLKTLHQPGEHTLILTILTAQTGDLLSATLMTPQPHAADDAQHNHNEEHDHDYSRFIWLVLLVAITFLGGFLMGKRRGSRQ
ncbi:hypothetical protein [Lacimicrobium sp. SS2-24]|uniref:hypothetical protein n=1 Tax=Lacimicrobium sp. SS2-24 TaxID=2005569 RepID=UPI001130ADCF|nr:hypothetical protein [Lacimicrobium sp. SS2-24]